MLRAGDLCKVDQAPRMQPEWGDDIMIRERLGILHPGAMGISIAASAQKGGCEVYWAAEGRSAATRERAARFGLTEAGTVAELCAACTVVVSVCPPHAAEEVAGQVMGCGFRGLYLDANAIAPQRAARIGQRMAEAGVDFVDGGIIGGPAWEAGKTWLYLAGPRAGEMASCFAGSPLQTRVLGETIGQASALKMCYAAYTKGSSALLAAILATAERLGVREALYEQWTNDDAKMVGQATQRVRGATAKAWRFVGEMEEIAATWREAGLPGEFHDAAAMVYRRLAQFKDAQPAPELETILAALLGNP